MVPPVGKNPEKSAFIDCPIWPPMGWGGSGVPEPHTRPQEPNRKLLWGGANWLIYKALKLLGDIKTLRYFL